MTSTLEIFAPQPEIECWVQGSEPPLIELLDQVVLIEVIQVNCPGCFIHALPEVIKLHETYEAQGLKVFVIATAFEHFEHNTLKNLQRLLQHGEVQGDPLTQLSKAGFLIDNKLPYSIPFSVAMDKLVKNENNVSREDIDQFILSQIPDFYQKKWADRRESIIQQAESYLKSKTYNARTFDMYKLQGTPSSILIDKEGILKQVSFGEVNQLEDKVQQLLKK